jgi:3-oxoacyl-(acyl-carrier-protein) synthase
VSAIVVTGIGVLSSLGNNVQENITALKNGNTGIGKAAYVKSRYADVLPFAEIKLSAQQLRELNNITDESVTRTQHLALLAAREAIANRGFDTDILSDTSTAIIVSSTVGGMYLTDELYHDANRSTEGSAYLSNYDCASVTLFLQEKLGIRGFSDTINTACSSGANAIMFGSRLIQQKIAKRAIVGGVDCLSKFTINGFNSLNILSDEPCRPFDNNRKGLNLGEGAGFLILEKSDDVPAEKIIAVISGYANSNDAFHPSALSDEATGPVNCMQQALNKANISSKDIDYINSHGTGTPNNDRAEGVAMQKIFGDTIPPFISCKSFIGHTLGAASAVESVFTLMAIKEGVIFASKNFSVPDEVTGLKPHTVGSKQTIKHALLNSFGFGGNCSSIVFSAYQG